tara:strand:+ start:85 stop:1380 length:1296 start_codon:yes stop_codon:yes gene_type:complete
MAVEYSEIMAATAMYFDTSVLDAAVITEKSLINWIKKAAVKADKNIVYGSQKNMFTTYMEQDIDNLSDKKKSDVLKNAIQGISAAKAIKEWLNSEHGEANDVKAKNLYMTGNVWPRTVKKFRINAFGFDDYNASDFIIHTGDKNFYGASLKKKPKPNSADPTLINKAFDTVLNGKQFDEVKEDITRIRSEYFAGLVRQAHEDKRIILPPSELTLSDKDLFEAKGRDTSIYERAYINTRGSVKHGLNNENAPDAMIKFVNEDLAKPNNILYKLLIKHMQNQGEIFANTLINLVLKVNLYDELAANKKLKDYNFGFGLITGVGTVTKIAKTDPAEYKPTLSQGKWIELHTILCGLRQLTANKQPYVIAVDYDKKENSNAAKVFFKLSKAGVPILDMELRYKGTFTAQPQFFATITPEFKQILVDECLVSAPPP